MMTRRAFITTSALGAIATAQALRIHGATGSLRPSVSVFSKVFQELKLSFQETAELTAEAGLDGIDCPVRPGGQIIPEQATQDLPKFSELLQTRGLKMLLLTTAIQNPDSSHAEDILRTASRLGIKYYRLGYWQYRDGTSASEQLASIKSQLKDLAAMNQQYGMCGLLQNHAGGNLVGANVRDNYELCRDLDPKQMGLAFDIGHAIHQLGKDWRQEFERLRTRLAVAYIKDFKPDTGFVPLGQGQIVKSGYIDLLKYIHYSGPISLHIEYDWSNHGTNKTKDGLLKALRADNEMLKQWFRS
jgi:sugar phosphate isomerase/epimerase